MGWHQAEYLPEFMRTSFAQKEGTNRISVGRVTPCATSGNEQPNVRPTTVAAGRGLPALPGRAGANKPYPVGRVTPCAPWSRVGGRSGFTLTELLVVITTLALSQDLDRGVGIKSVFMHRICRP